MKDGLATPTSAAGRVPFRLDSLLVLRGVAALLVVCHHRGVGPLMAAATGLPLLGAFAISGSYEVFIFFCISGYLIAKILSQDYGPDGLARYARNRAIRILPTYYLAVGFTLWAASYSLQRADWPVLLLLNNYIQTPLPNPALWSLATEVQFYLLAPLIAQAARRRPSAPAFLLALGVAVKFAYWLGYDLLPASVALRVSYQGLEANLLYFMAGWCAYRYRHALPTISPGLGLAVIGAMLLGIWLYHLQFIEETPRGLRHAPAWMVAFPILMAGVMMPLLPGLDDRGRLVATIAQPLRGALVIVGVTSYAAYVLHLAVFKLVDGPPVLQLVVVYALASLVHVIVERPFYRFRKL